MHINVEIFSSPGCEKCHRAKQVLHKLVIDLGIDFIQWREINILDELDYAVELGVLTTPAIAIDGELIYTRIPSVKNFRIELEKRMRQGS